MIHPAFAGVGVSIDRTPIQQAHHSTLLRLRSEARAAGNDAYTTRERLVVVMRPPAPSSASPVSPAPPLQPPALSPDPTMLASTSAPSA